ncbi:4-oxalocrotonate tautomerase family protein [Helicobacter sp. MIT 11-5569]|uniref:2-hydroxymuconate tautomerase family protein n=1 Tax=Helicobacter sp. MIT 11-5569 TaxID=1548151 RepID=UPI00051FF30B|nr:4-oxalocrotonate tautomerase family protein [Helicobacter sp. MIT 11-5569]TLD84058.1 4-oxalocrotonate tautomerase family protein [Helicobacter sp. MIT 11-5569]
MPYVNFKITTENGSPTKEQKEQIIKETTELLEKILNRSCKNAVIVIDEIPTDNYGFGGISITQKRAQS